MGPALWLFVLTVNLAPQTHVPKLASLPHASPTNVTFMSSFSQGRPHSLAQPRAFLTHLPAQPPHLSVTHIPCRHNLLTSVSTSPTSTPSHFSDLPPPLTYSVGSALISSTSCLGELFLAPLFPVFVISGKQFMSIYSLVKYRKIPNCRVAAERKKRNLPPPHPPPKEALFFLFGCELTKITTEQKWAMFWTDR